MCDINDFWKNYQDIYLLIESQGFYNAKIFKGFSKNEEHNLNILVYDIYEDNHEKESEPRVIRKLFLKDNLIKLLNCKIVISTEDQILVHYLKKVNNGESIILSKDLLFETLEKAFGKNWKFNQYIKNPFDYL